MVFYFTASDGTLLYMGKDKHENEDLLKHGLPIDVWFHVDGLSSAHVYARLAGVGGAEPPTWDALPPALLAECGQLVKANSIEGTKRATVTVIYTPFANLKKDGSMDVGQVGFRNDREVRRFPVGERDKDVLRALGRTKEERFPDLADEKSQFERGVKNQHRSEARERAQRDKELEAQRRADKEARSYDRLFTGAAAPAPAAAPAEDVSLARKVRNGCPAHRQLPRLPVPRPAPRFAAASARLSTFNDRRSRAEKKRGREDPAPD